MTYILRFVIYWFLFFAPIGFAEEATRTSKIKQFKHNQECLQSAKSQGQWDIAIVCAQELLQTSQDLFGPSHRNTAILTREYGLVLADAGQREESFTVLKLALRRYEKAYGDASSNMVDVLLDVAEAGVGRANTHNHPVDLYERAFEIYQKTSDYSELQYAHYITDAILVLFGHIDSLNRTRVVVDFGKEALQIYNTHLGSEHLATALTAFKLGKLVNNHPSKMSEAVMFFQQALKNSEVAPFAHAFLADTYLKANNPELAKVHIKASQQSDSGIISQRFNPIFVEQPKYPPKAIRSGREGYAIVKLTISETGAVKDLQLIEEQPLKWGFGDAAMEVASKLRYSPQIIGGSSTDVPNVRYKYTFKMRKRR